MTPVPLSSSDHYVYDAFGNETDHTGSNDFLFKYTGRAFDDETGLQNNLNRWFDPTVGRWLSEDPIGFSAGDANVYRYVGNFSTGAVDPSGLDDYGYDPTKYSFRPQFGGATSSPPIAVDGDLPPGAMKHPWELPGQGQRTTGEWPKEPMISNGDVFGEVGEAFDSARRKFDERHKNDIAGSGTPDLIGELALEWLLEYIRIKGGDRLYWECQILGPTSDPDNYDSAGNYTGPSIGMPPPTFLRPGGFGKPRTGGLRKPRTLNDPQAVPKPKQIPLPRTSKNVNIPTTGRKFNQIQRRGWTEQSIRNTVQNPHATRPAVNKATGNNATAYFNKDGTHVVIDDVTNDLVQLSDRVDPTNWIPDPTIQNPYCP